MGILLYYILFFAAVFPIAALINHLIELFVW
jgi:hypothetical protein